MRLMPAPQHLRRLFRASAVLTAACLLATALLCTVPAEARASDTSDFIASISEQARDIAADSDLYASVMIAQAVLESGSGTSALSQPPYNNLFGIKGSYGGSSVTMGTAEDDGTGSHYGIDAEFRSYPSAYESMLDYADLLTNAMGGYYAPARRSRCASYVDACDYLQGRYATDTSYSVKLQTIIATYGLTRYDAPSATITASRIAVPTPLVASPQATLQVEWSSQPDEASARASEAPTVADPVDNWSAGEIAFALAMLLAEGLVVFALVRGA